MSITQDMFLPIFGVNDEDQQVRKVAIAAVRAGYAVVPLPPMSKKPTICTLTARELKEAGTNHKCGVHHAITDDKAADRIFKRLEKQHAGELGLGIVNWPSRIITIDADVESEVHAFQSLWAENEGGMIGPTVMTPGQVDREGVWQHKNGGHFHFRLPDGYELDLGRGSLKDESGYVIKWGWYMSAVPPTVRKEGPYVARSNVPEAPAWLLERIERFNQAVAERNQDYVARLGSDDIGKWSAATSWGDLLVPDGWTETGKFDRCGCPIFERPGGGSSTWKSATAHENVCGKYENAEDHGPMHIWTDYPPAPLDEFIAAHGRTITKLRYVAVVHHAGDIEAAKVALGIGANALSWLNDLPASESRLESPPESQLQDDHLDEDESQSQSLSPGDPGTGGPEDTSGSPANPTVESQPTFWVDEDGDEDDRLAIIQAAKQEYRRERAREYLAHKRGLSGPMMDDEIISLDDDPDPVVPTVATREDGPALLYRGRVNTIFGPSEAGKSWFTLACAASVIAAGGRVIVVDMEDDKAGFIGRLRTIGLNPDGRIRYFRPFASMDAAVRKQIAEASSGADLIILDSLDAYMALNGMDSNSAVSIRTAGAWMKSLAASSNAAVLVVDHATEKQDGPAKTQLGSSAKKQFIDGTTLRADRRTAWRPGHPSSTYVMAGKDRHGWAKAHAEFGQDPEWGRMALLSMDPDLADDGSWVARLRLQKPADYASDSGTSNDHLLSLEDQMIDKARSRPGEWISRTALFQAAGDKNGRGAQPEALKRLVDQGVLEHREVELKGNRTGHEYRYTELPDEPESPNP